MGDSKVCLNVNNALNHGLESNKKCQENTSEHNTTAADQCQRLVDVFLDMPMHIKKS